MNQSPPASNFLHGRISDDSTSFHCSGASTLILPRMTFVCWTIQPRESNRLGRWVMTRPLPWPSGFYFSPIPAGFRLLDEPTTGENSCSVSSHCSGAYCVLIPDQNPGITKSRNQNTRSLRGIKEAGLITCIYNKMRHD